MVKFPNIKVKLTGKDGNAFAIMGRVASAMKRAHIPQPEIDIFYKDCQSGDYDHLLQVCMNTVDCT